MIVKIDYRVQSPLGDSTIGVFIRSDSGYPLYAANSTLMKHPAPIERGEHTICLELQQLDLTPGLYDVTVVFMPAVETDVMPHDWKKHVYDSWFRMPTFQILPEQPSDFRVDGPIRLSVSW